MIDFRYCCTRKSQPMRALILPFLLLTFSASAQIPTPTYPPPPLPQITLPQADMVEAGVHMEKDGKKRTAALIAALGGAAIATVAIASADGEDAQVTAGAAIGGLGMVIGVVLNFSAAGEAKKAGRILQGKPL